jgi:hypothetical protein
MHLWMKYGLISLFWIAVSGIFEPLKAQFFVSGEAPASIHWMEIRQDGYQVVFPEGLQKDASLFISYLKRTAASTEIPYHKPARFVPMLMNTSSVRSNGVVTWTPRRMELIVTPPQESYAQDWLAQLALHEYRHVVQISQLDQGFTSVLSWFTGEIGMGISTAVMPSWFYEGDAVSNETRYSLSGRGRLPSFEMPVRTLLTSEPKVYAYNKALLGSYRDVVPNQYEYGYPIVNYVNSHYGRELWPKAMDYSARHLYLFSPLTIYFIFHHHTGKGKVYLAAMDSLKKQYDKEEGLFKYSNYSNKNRRESSGPFTSYKFPHALPGGKIFAVKTGIDQLDEFVIIDSLKKEKRLLIPGTLSDDYANVNGNRIVWNEIVSDPRWEMRSFSEIRTLDLASGKTRRLTRKTRYFSPSFSPDGSKIAVAETDLLNQHFLTVLDSKSGTILYRISSDGNRELTYPVWINDRLVCAITVSARGKQIESVDLAHPAWQTILPYTHYNISELAATKNCIYFRSSYEEIENIYALDIPTKKLFRITGSRFGAFYPSPDTTGKSIFFSDYSAKGFNIASVPIRPSEWEAVHPTGLPSGRWPDTNPENDLIPADTSGMNQAHVLPYNKLTHLFHVHSWLPFYIPIADLPDNFNGLPIEPGLMIFSQNLLSTFISSIGYHYSNGYHYLTPRFTWKGWYPVFELTGDVGGPVHTFDFPEGVKPSGVISPYYNYHLSSYVPLIFDRGKWISFLQPRIEYEHNSTVYYLDGNQRQGLDYLHTSLYATRYLRMSYRDLYPRIGAWTMAWYTVTPGDGGQLGNMLSVEGGVYLPGLARHHSLLVRGGWQKQYPGLYYLSGNRLFFPRGYHASVSASLSSFKADYAFPFAYPDFSAGPVLYLKRLRADLFYDRSYGEKIFDGSGAPYTGSYSSAGLEIYADFHLGRIIFPISAGIRTGYRFNSNRVFTEFVFNFQLR